VQNLKNLNDNFLHFMKKTNQENVIYHLNGHRGFFEQRQLNNNNKEILEIKDSSLFDEYWNGIDWL
jgi:hypothetical protein